MPLSEKIQTEATWGILMLVGNKYLCWGRHQAIMMSQIWMFERARLAPLGSAKTRNSGCFMQGFHVVLSVSPLTWILPKGILKGSIRSRIQDPTSEFLTSFDWTAYSLSLIHI